MHIGRNKLSRWILKWVNRGVSVSAFVLGPMRLVGPDQVWSGLQPTLVHIQHGLYIPMALIFAPLTGWLRRSLDNARLDDVHGLLDQMRAATFRNETPELEQHRRVTLFRHRKFAFFWPCWGGILVPVERSGTSTRKTKAYFCAPDDGEKCEGVAGRTWGSTRIVQVSNLPDLKAQPSDEEVSEYARRTFISERRTRRYLGNSKTAPRSLLGIPIEVNSKMWGVLVFDSTGEEIKKKAANEIFKKLNPTLTGYLKGL